MPRNLETTSEVKTYMVKEDYEAVKAAADNAEMSIADYVREAIAAYMKRPITPVNRGGWRGGSKQSAAGEGDNS